MRSECKDMKFFDVHNLRYCYSILYEEIYILLPNTCMTIFTKLSYFYKRKIEPGFKISKDALVVDIGSGDKPFWRADVYVDSLSFGNVQRTTRSQTIHDIGTFVDAKVENLPFKDNAFDFSFCSHLLEHVPDPQKAIKEITRISKAGYIEVPNGVIETIQPFDSHLWFIFANKNTLFFSRKSKKMHDVLTENGQKYGHIIGRIEEPFIRKYWKKNVEVEIFDTFKESEKFYADNKKHAPKEKSFNGYLQLVKCLRALFYKQKQIPEKIYTKK